MNINIHDTGMALRMAMHMVPPLAGGIKDAIQCGDVSYIGDGICDGMENMRDDFDDKIDGIKDFFGNLFW